LAAPACFTILAFAAKASCRTARLSSNVWRQSPFCTFVPQFHCKGLIAMQTPVEFYVRLPVNLYRAGTPTRPKFDYLRTMPPRTEEQAYDVKVDTSTGLIDHRSGGLSLFDKPNLDYSDDWWLVPAGTKLPPGFTLSKDTTGNKFRGHFSIRALHDMPIDLWKKTLADWANNHASHINRLQQAKRNV
jgi:hypothetical protein